MGHGRRGTRGILSAGGGSIKLRRLGGVSGRLCCAGEGLEGVQEKSRPAPRTTLLRTRSERQLHLPLGACVPPTCTRVQFYLQKYVGVGDAREFVRNLPRLSPETLSLGLRSSLRYGADVCASADRLDLPNRLINVVVEAARNSEESRPHEGAAAGRLSC